MTSSTTPPPNPAPQPAPQPSPPSPPREPLDYETAPTAQQRHARDVRDFILAALFATVATMAIGFLWIICNLRIGALGPPPSQRIGFPLACATAVGGLLVWIAVHRWRRRRSKAFALGLLVGLAIGLLIEGFCITSL
jgi:4-amino-4-deoxy-L-arabinose transferase-like glycosyltransferase